MLKNKETVLSHLETCKQKLKGSGCISEERDEGGGGGENKGMGT